MNFRYIIFDTETTGISADKQAVEIALVEIDEHLNILGEAQSLLKPSVPITAEAKAVHQITEDMLADCPTIDEWVLQGLGGPLEGDVILIGHRVDFDKPLFAPIGNCVHTIDTLPFSFEHFPEAPNKKLDTLKEYLNLPGGGTSHRAMADVLTCHQLLCHLKPLVGWSLYEMATTPFTVHYMPWGKHEGKLLHEVPRGYREFILREYDLEPNLKRSLEQAALLDPPRKQVVMGRTPRILIPTRKSR